MNATRWIALLTACVVPLSAHAQAASQQGPTLQDKHTSFGALASPAMLPAGATAAYGFFGVPKVGAGYRYGAGLLEVEGRATFDYFTLGLAAEGFARYAVHTDGPLQVAPSLGLGLVYDTGSRYIDRYNYQYLGLRLTPGAIASYRVAETAAVVGELTVPIDLPLTTQGSRVTPMIGGGGEIYIGEDMTAGAIAEVGVDVTKQPFGRPVTRFAFALRVGLGYRFF